MVGGGRNGRYVCKWASIVLFFLGLVYVFYLYRDVRSVLREKEEELARLDELQGRMSEQLRDLVNGHTTLQEDLKNERVAHHRTRLDKGSVEKQCQEDLKALKANGEDEKLQLEQERDSYKSQLEEESEDNRRLQEQQDRLASQYDKDMVFCNEERERATMEHEAQLDEKELLISAYTTKYVECQTELQRLQSHYSKCTTEVDSLKDEANVKEYRITSLQSDLGRCQNNLEGMTAQREKADSQLRGMEFKMPAGQTAQQKVSASDREALLKRLTERSNRGEKLSEKELRALELLRETADEDSIFDQGGREFKREVPPHAPHDRNDQRGPPFHHPEGGQFGGPENENRNPGRVGQAPFGMDHGRQQPLPPRNGMGTKTGGFAGHRRELPELAEQEEVRVLQLEEQEPAGVRGREREEEEEKLEEDVDEGMAFDPADKEERGEEEEEGVEYDLPRERSPENLNLPSPNADDKPAMPVPNRVVQEEEEEYVRSPPRFDQDLDVQFDQFRQDQLEREQEEEGDELADDEGGDDDIIDVAVVRDDYVVDRDELGDRQFEEDMKLDQQERAMRRQQLEGWDEVMQEVEQEMNQDIEVKDLRRQEIVGDMEERQQQELQRRLNQDGRFGQREQNLR